MNKWLARAAWVYCGIAMFQISFAYIIGYLIFVQFDRVFTALEKIQVMK